MSALPVFANPTGGTVGLGSATFSSSGSTFNINQSSANAFINWQSFNINQGETVNFNQPSSSSVTWNYINDPNAPAASTINGDLNANGYVILQNPNGITVGGSAVINAHGLVMTTASTPNLDLSSGGPWTFNTPPPSAQIVNYGKINITGGGTAFLIGADIVNNGTINAPNGHIGLYDGETVLVSTSPNGQGLSAAVTLPQGSVDNEGNLTANGGSVIAQALMVNQNGIIQANSAQNVNGTIELLGGSSVTLGANSAISAAGDSTASGPSAGGSVTIQAGNTFSDQAGSTIDISGGAQGGNGGSVSICAPEMESLQTVFNGQAANGYVDGVLSLDPQNIQLVSSGGNGTSSQYSSGTVGASDPPTTGTLVLDVNDFSSTLADISLQAVNNIEVSTTWTLPSSITGTLTLTAGNDINFDAGSGINGNNWTVNLNAGTAFSGSSAPAHNSDGIYLFGTATIQTQGGNINLWAANEVQVGWPGTPSSPGTASAPGVPNSGTGAIRTEGGGSISVTTEFGDVNSGAGTAGFDYHATAPYFTPDLNLGGISTALGGNVTINAGGNVVSFSATKLASGDPGIGAFGTEPGNVTITAGQNVYGNFTVVNGTGVIDAGNEIGTSSANVALSLVDGSWELNAGWDPITQTIQGGMGDIFLQEVRNPNGVFNATSTGSGHNIKPSPGNHLFDYGLDDSVTLNAGNSVNLTGFEVPRLANVPIPVILPPTLIINAGAGGVVLDQPSAVGVTLTGDDYITLFPSPVGNLEISTTDGGNLIGNGGNGSIPYLLMSDSGLDQWSTAPTGAGVLEFGPQDHAITPPELGNENPVQINISGSMENVTLQVSKLADITVEGDMINCSFFGENLNLGDVTSINVGGQIYYTSSFTFVTLSQALPDLAQLSELLPSGESFLSPNAADLWYSIFADAVNPDINVPSANNNADYTGDSASELEAILQTAANKQFTTTLDSTLNYNPATGLLIATGPLAAGNLAALEAPYVYLPVYEPSGIPLLDSNGHFVLDKVAWSSLIAPDIAEFNTLDVNSQGKPQLGVSQGALIVGGTGYFDITAGSINLGNSAGILTMGNGGTPALPFPFGFVSYSYLTPYIASAPGATINITTGTLEMPSSTIAALGAGDVNVTVNGELPASIEDPLNANGVGVSMDLGSPDLAIFDAQIMAASNLGLGIYTAGGGAVNVLALGTINVDTSRIGTFNGGNVNITSLTGDVNAGSGGNVGIPINTFPATGPLGNPPPDPYEYVFANGIVADTLALNNGELVPGAAAQPGDIIVTTPQGSIYASLGGILQESLGEPFLPGPYITLNAGSSGYVGNVELGNSGAIGGTVNVIATGKVSGLLISAQNANITSQTVGGLTVLAAGTANVSAQSGSGGITIVGGAGVNASGVGTATLLGQNVSVNNAAAQSTLGSSAQSTSTSTSAAGQTSDATQQQVASNVNTGDDKKKKNAQLRKVGRVTVILASASSNQF